MMKRHSAITCCALFILVGLLALNTEAQTNTPALGATIKRKDGKVVEGKTEGFIVLKGKVSKEVKKDKPGVVNHSAPYWLLNGDQIVRIDECGVERKSDDVVAFGLAMREGADPDDLVVLAKLFDERNTDHVGLVPTSDASTWLFASWSGKSKQGKTLSDSLLGEYRRDPNSRLSGASHNRGTLLSSIRVTTANGTVSVEVAEIVSFTVPCEAKPER